MALKHKLQASQGPVTVRCRATRWCGAIAAVRVHADERAAAAGQL
jgi:hypothetical protein